MRVILRNSRILGGNKPYVIAEMNSSHNGDMDVAKAMIDSAKECGCDCVKFQSWSAESLYSDEYYKRNPISKRIVKKFALADEQLLELAVYCEKVGIDFSSTPYSNEEVDFLVKKIKAPFIKISSMEIDNIPFLKYIAESGVPMILSTGMSSIEEIRCAVKAIESTGNRQLCILHCVSLYPADANTINLKNLLLLRDEFPDYPLGYSDHTQGIEIAAASIALGASIIEKHFSLDNKKMGMDNNMATEPAEMRALVRACHNVYNALGNYERVIGAEETLQKKKMRRSLVAARYLTAGTVLSSSDLIAKRPGEGISPAELEHILGKRLVRDIENGHMLQYEDVD